MRNTGDANRWWHTPPPQPPAQQQQNLMPPPGWYPDTAGMMRWWDGAVWTAHTQPQPPPARRSGVSTGVVWLIVLAVFAGLYVVFHAYVYRNCLFAPGIFGWPSACL